MLKKLASTLFVTRRAGSQSSCISHQPLLFLDRRHRYQRALKLFSSGLGLLIAGSTFGSSLILTFEDFPLGDPPNDGSQEYLQFAGAPSFDPPSVPTGTYYNNGSAKTDPASPFQIGAANLGNSYNSLYQSWSGFAISNTTDTTTNWYSNQYSAISGGGHNSSQYAVFYYSAFEDETPHMSFDQLLDLGNGGGFSINNVTYPYLDMLNGSGFSKQFGGASGDDPDYFSLTAEGFLNGESTGIATFYLADFRFDDNSLDYLLSDWTWFDLSALGVIDSLNFSFDSSDAGAFGLNTPTYFALDNFTGTLIPEPGVFTLVLLGAALGLCRRNRRN